MISSSYKTRKDLKNEKFTITNSIWNKHRLNSRKNVGCLNEIFKKYYNDNKSIFDNLTPDDFVKYYFENYMDINKFKELSNKFYTYCKAAGVNITKNEAFDFCIIRVLDETWDGFKREIDAVNNLKKWYPESDVRFSTDNDMEYCIDLEVWYDDIFLDAYQVKPVSFLKGLEKHKEYCVDEYYYINERHKKFYERYKIRPMYYISDENNVIVKDFMKLVDF